MCGRMIMKLPRDEMNTLFTTLNTSQVTSNYPPRYNIAPTQNIFFVTAPENTLESSYMLQEGMWWLIPHWAKEKPKYPTFNARLETVHTKPTFRDAYKAKRCLIPISGYYEWKTTNKRKQPYCVIFPDQEPMALAGLWQHNTHLNITSCTLITTEATDNLQPLHHRMPIALPQEAQSVWLNPEAPIQEVTDLLDTNRAGDFIYYPVDPAVGNVRNEGSYLMEEMRTLL